MRYKVKIVFLIIEYLLIFANYSIMRGLNKVMLIGNLGKDPEFLLVDNSIPLAKFSMATTENRKDKSGEAVSQTEWHNVVLWRGLADLAKKYLHKGSLVYIEGKLHTRVREEQDGTKKFKTEVIGETLIMLDKKNHSEKDSDDSNIHLSSDSASPSIEP